MSAGLHAHRGDPRRYRLVVVVVAVLAVIAAVLLLWRLRPAPPVEAADCGSDAPTVTLAAAPDIEPTVRSAIEDLDTESICADFEVVAERSDRVVTAMVARSDGAPDLWIPDGSAWLAQLAASGAPATVLAKAVATSPVVLVGGPAADTPDTWLDAMGSGRLTMRDPLSTGTGTLALLAPRAEAAASKASDGRIKEVLVPLAQQYGARQAAGGADSDPLAGLGATAQRVVPTTEQGFLQAKRENSSLTAVVPGTGAMLQDFPLVAQPGAPEEVTEAGTALGELLVSEEGRAAMSADGFRGADAAPLPEGAGLGEVELLSPPDLKAAAGDLRSWQVLSVPGSLLAVLDASGSMDFETSEGSRMQLAVGAAQAALGFYPSQARIGLWVFSIDQGGPGKDHRELVPLRRLDEQVAGRTQRDELLAKVAGAVDLTQGGTGLYDTTLAAYREALAKYDPAYFNSVVLMTDGANDDPSSIGLRELLDSLRRLTDPERPVRIIAIGISEDADMGALTQIAQATNGQAFPVKDPRDILEVFSQALLGR